MATDSILLSLPIELRWNIYSYLCINKELILIDPNAARLSQTCWQLHIEIHDYHYSVDVLDLDVPSTYVENEMDLMLVK